MIGRRIDIPCTGAGCSTSEVVDPVPAGRGVLNGLVRIGFDTQGQAVVSYHKCDSYRSADLGSSQIYNARREAAGWRSYQATGWSCRWDFGGGGTLAVAVGVGAVAVEGGRPTRAFSINRDLPRYCDALQRVVCQPDQLPTSRLVVYELETFGS